MESKKQKEQEIWKAVKGFEDKYEISNLGNLVSNNWNKTGQRRYVKTYLNRKTGYVYVNLANHGKVKTTTIHRLVAEAFIPNPDNLEQVDHIDNNRQNNVYTNLRWVSRQFNNSRPHAIEMRKRNYRNTKHSHQFVKAKKDSEIRYFKNALQTSKALGCSNVSVVKALNGQTFSAKGWVLEYVDRNLPECAEFRHQVWLDKMNNVPPNVKQKIELRFLSIQRKERVNQKILEFKEQRENERRECSMLGNPRPQYSRTVAETISEFKREARVVVQIDLDGNTVREWENTHVAQRVLGINGINKVLFGLKDQIGGYVWKWKLDI